MGYRSSGSHGGSDTSVEHRTPWRLLILLLACLLVLSAFTVVACTSEEDLVRILQTEQDATARQEAAADLAGRHSLTATQQLTAAAATDATAAGGLAALADAYFAILSDSVQKAVESAKGFDEKTALRLEETVDCLAAIGGAKAAHLLGAFASVVGRTIPGLLDLQSRCMDALAGFSPEVAAPELVGVVSSIGTNQYSQQIATQAKDGLRAMGEPAAEVLLGRLGAEDWVADLLTAIGAPAVGPLAEALDESDPAARYLALGVLLQIYQSDSSAVTTLLAKPEMTALLVDARCDAGYGDVRDDDLEILLGQIGTPALPKLLDVFPDNDWAGTVVAGMGADVVPQLAAALGAQPCAEELLAMIGGPAIPEVVSLLDDPDEAIRHRALGALLRMYVYMVPEVDPVLLTADMVPRLLRDLASFTAGLPDYGGFDHVAWAETVLIDTGEPAIAPVLASDYEWKWWLLQEMGATAVPVLTTTMHGDDREDAIMAAATLAMMAESSPSAVEHLTAALDNEDLKMIADNHLFYIALGREGSEEVIGRALNAYGKKQMALDCLNCGNETLDAAGRTWARQHGYVVRTKGEPGDIAPLWGGTG